jgi:hypothetical protein
VFSGLTEGRRRTLTGFTAEELADIRRWDAEIDSKQIPEEKLQACDQRDIRFSDPKIEKRRQQCRVWRRNSYQRNRQKEIERSKAQYQRKKDDPAFKAYKRDFFRSHKEDYNARHRAWYAANIERERAKARERVRKKREALKCAPSSAGQSGT